jgi:hypothetical protein
LQAILQLITAAVLAILSGLTALVSAVLVKVFEEHARRNFDSAKVIREKLSGSAKTVLDELRPTESRAEVRVLNFSKWLTITPLGSTGRIFGFFFAISLLGAAISVMVLLMTFCAR